MAGHSKFKNIMYRKGAQDAKRARVFARIGREITVAARSNPDPDYNPRLRAALALARSSNMPKDNIKKAIDKASGDDKSGGLEEVRYEGYGINGVAVIVETLTDNRNRTASEVRSTFSKYGGNLGETGSVAFMFEQTGYVCYPKNTLTLDQGIEFGMEHGAKDVEEDEDGLRFICTLDDFCALRDACLEKFGDPVDMGLAWIPLNTVQISKDAEEKFEKMMDVLENIEDVQDIFSNHAVE